MSTEAERAWRQYRDVEHLRGKEAAWPPRSPPPFTTSAVFAVMREEKGE